MTNKSEIIKTTCPFCLYGCTLPILETSRGSFIVRKIEYDVAAQINQGRLCARGNAATMILDDRQRLTSPLFKNKKIDWVIALSQIKHQLKDFSSKEIAITFDINNTLEDLDAIFNFANGLKVDTIARSYLEPETFFSYSLPDVKYAELKDIERGKVFLIIGDIFSKIPLLAKPILDAKYANRNNRLFYIDSLKTRVSGFANRFLWTRPGTEPLLILALIATMSKTAKSILGDKNFSNIRKVLPLILETCNISPDEIMEISKALSTISKGVIFAAMDYGKTDDPFLFSELAQLLSLIIPGDKTFCAPALTSIPVGKIRFSELIESINQGKTKVLINFGEIFPDYYPTVASKMNNLKFFVTTTTYLNNSSKPNWILPIPSILEKSGTIMTLWGKANIKPLAKPVNGSKSISEIIDKIAPDLESSSKMKVTEKTTFDIDTIIDRALNLIEQKRDTKDEMTILGEESAFGYRGIFTNDAKQLKISQINAQKLNLKQGDLVKLITNNIEKKFVANITNTVPTNVIAVPTDTPENRILFPMQIDNTTKDFIIAPAKGKLNKLI